MTEREDVAAALASIDTALAEWAATRAVVRPPTTPLDIEKRRRQVL